MKQYLPKGRIAQYIGGLYNQTMRTLAYWSVVNSTILLILGWQAQIGGLLTGWFPWLTFPMFVIGVLLVALLIMIIDLCFILPAVVSFGNKQSVLHDNPIYQKVDKIESELAELKNKIGNDINLM
jgi:hypothetical protein